MSRIREDRWRGRPVLAAGLRFVVFAGPIGAAVATSALIGPHLPRSDGAGSLLLRWVILLVCSTIVLVATDRVARRLLPLVVLLKLSLAFPSEAPSRLAVARSAANLKQLEERVRIARTTGFVEEPAVAAEMILSLVAAVEAHDRATRGHSERVRVYTELIGQEMKLYPEDRDRLRWAAMLHDVGKLEVPRSVLNKPGPLDPAELEVVRRHPEEGARMTAPMHAWLGEWANAIVEHHERFDGRGYPSGRGGADISLAARIVAVADVYETMTAARPYHRPKSPHRAREELVRCAGTQFDPSIVRAFLQVSVRRLRLVSGPLSWLAQWPVLRGLEGVAAAAARVTSGAAVAGGTIVMSLTPVQARAAGDHRPVPIERSAGSGEQSQPAPDPSSVSPTPWPSGPTSIRPSASPTPGGGRAIDPAPSPSPSPSPTMSLRDFLYPGSK
ncbi:MAG: HD-GYP domain-containing protein [Actinomycetota bacterium]